MIVADHLGTKLNSGTFGPLVVPWAKPATPRPHHADQRSSRHELIAQSHEGTIDSVPNPAAPSVHCRTPQRRG
jgi:hypothetical protein